MTYLSISEIYKVDPARLAAGQWCHRADKTIGEGDIHASYSADRIGMGQPLRKPFTWNGALWVCVSLRHCNGEVSAEAYRLVHPQVRRRLLRYVHVLLGNPLFGYPNITFI